MNELTSMASFRKEITGQDYSYVFKLYANIRACTEYLECKRRCTLLSNLMFLPIKIENKN